MRNPERTALQSVVAVACLVPLLAGGAGVLLGPGMLGVAGPIALDSHYRYLSGLLFGVGVGFASTVPGIERNGARFRLLTGIVVMGGLARLLSVVLAGAAGLDMTLALAMELVVTPALAVWQARVARLTRTAESGL